MSISSQSSTSQAAAKPDKGFDYGIKPSAMAFANQDFLLDLQRAKPQGLGFATLEHFGLIPNPQCVALMVDNIEAAHKWFSTVRSWSAPPYTGDGIEVELLYEADRPRYWIRLQVNVDAMIERLMGLGASENFDVLSTFFQFLNWYPLSEHSRRFRALSANMPFVFTYCDARGRMYLEDAVLCPKIIIHEVSSLPEDPHLCTTPLLSIGRSITDGTPERKVPTSSEVAIRRKQVLRRLFPVTGIRLDENDSYIEAIASLRDTHSDWQLRQAACNLIIKKAWHKESKAGPEAPMPPPSAIFDYCEHADDGRAAAASFTSSAIRQQVNHDVKSLWNEIRGSSTASALKGLKAGGYLE